MPITSLATGLSLMSSYEPGTGQEYGWFRLATDETDHILFTTQSGSGAYYEVEVLADLSDPALPEARWARIGVGPTFSGSKRMVSGQPKIFGPLFSGQSIHYWGDSDMVVPTDVEWSRVV